MTSDCDLLRRHEFRVRTKARLRETRSLVRVGGTAEPDFYGGHRHGMIVLYAGGAKSGRPAGGSLVAFALPE